MTAQPRYNVNHHNDERIAAAVDKIVPRELLSVRDAGINSKFYYLKGDVDADRLNEIFGPLGWSLQAGNPSITKFEDKRTQWRFPEGAARGAKKVPVEVEMTIYAVTTPVTLTIKTRSDKSTDTVFQQTGVGYGEVEIGKHAKDAIAMAVKGAETDGLKRCASLLGKAFGMFLNSSGDQGDIEYAHNNNRDALAAARATRKQSEREAERSSNDNGEREVRRDDRPRDEGRRTEGAGQTREEGARTQANGRDAESRERSQASGDTQEGRSSPQSERKTNPAPRTEGNGRPEAGARANSEREDSAENRAETSRDAASENTKPRGRPRADVNEDYDLETVPLTRSDQTSFGATLKRKMDEAAGESARINLVRKHRDTILNFDTPVKSRIVQFIGGHGINIDQVAR